MIRIDELISTIFFTRGPCEAFTYTDGKNETQEKMLQAKIERAKSFDRVIPFDVEEQGRMGRGIQGLPKVSSGPAIPDPSMPCRRATLETDLRPFQGWPARKAGDL
jgi:hypothetical protein